MPSRATKLASQPSQLVMRRQPLNADGSLACEPRGAMLVMNPTGTRVFEQTRWLVQGVDASQRPCGTQQSETSSNSLCPLLPFVVGWHVQSRTGVHYKGFSV